MREAVPIVEPANRLFAFGIPTHIHTPVDAATIASKLVTCFLERAVLGIADRLGDEVQ
jgi:hypothetical protein